jgi:hypothetical protein
VMHFPIRQLINQVCYMYAAISEHDAQVDCLFW